MENFECLLCDTGRVHSRDFPYQEGAPRSFSKSVYKDKSTLANKIDSRDIRTKFSEMSSLTNVACVETHLLF